MIYDSQVVKWQLCPLLTIGPAAAAEAARFDSRAAACLQIIKAVARDKQLMAVKFPSAEYFNALKEQMAKMEESQLKITELLEVMKIAKSSDGKVGKDRTMLDEKRRVTIG